MELDQIKKIVACVITSQGRTGTAFLISQTHALTCAHCVATVENRNVSHVRKRVKLEFTEWQIANKTRHASVAEVDGRRDVALLTLDQPIDKELIPIALNGIIEEEWKTFAYPDSLEKDGMPFDGEVTDLDATFYGNRGYLLLRCRQGRDAVAGASGGPIVVSDAIIGILSNQPLDEHKNPLFHTIYGVPVKKIEDLVKTAGVKLTPRQRTLKGQVFLVGQDEEMVPAQRVGVTFAGHIGLTNEEGLFSIGIPISYKAGEKITLTTNKEGWRIWYPLDGETIIPADLNKDLIRVRLLPKGSKRFWTDDRIEKFIQDLIEKVKLEVQAAAIKQEIDFSGYIKEWASKYGFTAQELKTQIDQWVSEAEQQNDPHKLGLAAFAKKNFGQASTLFTKSARAKVERLKHLEEQQETLSQEAVMAFRLAGRAHYSYYAFDNALAAFQEALQYLSKDKTPHLWAGVMNDVGLAHKELGIRTDISAAHEHHDAAASAFRQALEVCIRDHRSQDWARIKCNLGLALLLQSHWSGPEERRRLLDEAMVIHLEVLKVFTHEQFPEDWAHVQNDLGNTLREQSELSNRVEGQRLLIEAVAAHCEALKVFTRKQFPLGFARAQLGLGGDLIVQVRLLEKRPGAKGEVVRQLLGEAIKAFREALKVYTRKQLPQRWALVQNYLALALLEQGRQADAVESRRLLGKAVTAYRNALKVYTREQLPQPWAITQHGLGNALRQKGLRSDVKEGRRLLGDAVTAYREALKVFTREQLKEWALIQHNLWKVLREQARLSDPEEGLPLIEQACIVANEIQRAPIPPGQHPLGFLSLLSNPHLGRF